MANLDPTMRVPCCVMLKVALICTATDRNMTIVMVMEAGEICQSCIIQPYSQCHTQVKEQVLV